MSFSYHLVCKHFSQSKLRPSKPPYKEFQRKDRKGRKAAKPQTREKTKGDKEIIGDRGMELIGKQQAL
jgi:hypothetical protein